MQELSFEQVEEVSGAVSKLWQYIAENYITVMGNGECGCGGPAPYVEDVYPGVGLPPY